MREADSQLFGIGIREYVDAAEWPAVGLALAMAFVYIGSYWLDVSYLNLMAPLSLMLQVVAAVATAYFIGICGGFSFAQTVTICLMVGFVGGVVSGFFSLIRFWYLWLVLNLAAEPVWAALLAGFVGAITLGFFYLPGWLARFRAAPEQSS